MGKTWQSLMRGLALLSLFAPAVASAAPKKIAIMVVDWSDRYFTPEADALALKLKSTGWTVIPMKEQTETFESITAAILKKLDIVAQGDQVLLDIQAHGEAARRQMYGTNVSTGEKLPDGGSFLTPLVALQIDNNAATMKYPFDDDEFLSGHSVQAPVLDRDGKPMGWPHILGYDMRIIAKKVQERGGIFSILDHSCNAGATVRLFERNHPGVCVIGTAGITTPGLAGYPAVSNAVAAGKNLNDLAEYITGKYYTDSDKHPVGNRIQSIGFRPGCTDTLPLREMLTIAGGSGGGAYGVWMAYGQRSPSHVFLEPRRYTTAIDLSPWVPHPGDDVEGVTGAKFVNPELRGSQAVIRWQSEAVSGFLAKRALAIQMLEMYGASYIHQDVVDAFSKVASSEAAYGEALKRFNNSLRVSWQNTKLGKLREDDIYRRTLVGRCQCTSNPSVRLGNLGCYYIASDDFNGFKEPIDCENPKAWITKSYFNFPGAVEGPWGRAAIWDALTKAQAALDAAVKRASDAIRVAESCSSVVCTQQKL